MQSDCGVGGGININSDSDDKSLRDNTVRLSPASRNKSSRYIDCRAAQQLSESYNQLSSPAILLPPSSSFVSKRNNNNGGGGDDNNTNVIGESFYPSCQSYCQSLLNSKTGVILDLLNAILSIIACILYIVEVYTSSYYKFAEIILASFFLIDYVIRLYSASISPSQLRNFIKSAQSIVDLVTIIPVFIIKSDSPLILLRVANVLRVSRALRILRLKRLIKSRPGGYHYELTIAIVSIVAFVFVATGVFQSIESDHVSLHESLYFILVTISTVGYGDITPNTVAGKALVVILILLIIIIVPNEVSKLTALHSVEKTSRYTLAYENSTSTSGGHVVLLLLSPCTDDNAAAEVEEFLSEFYHVSRGVIGLDVVIVSTSTSEVSKDLKRILANVLYHTRVHYIHNMSLLSQEGRTACSLSNARAVFISYHNITSKTLDLSALCIRKHTSASVYVKGFSNTSSNLLSLIVGNNQVMNVEEIEYRILSATVLRSIPGLITLVLNLLRSVSPTSNTSNTSSQYQWQTEYSIGASHQIFPLILKNESLNGKSLGQVATVLNQVLGVTLLATYYNGVIQLTNYHHIRYTGVDSDLLCFFIGMSASQVHLINDTNFFISSGVNHHSMMSLGHSSSTSSLTGLHASPLVAFSSNTVLRRQSPTKTMRASINDVFEISPPSSPNYFYDDNVPSTPNFDIKEEELVLCIVCGEEELSKYSEKLLCTFSNNSNITILLAKTHSDINNSNNIIIGDSLNAADLVRAGLLRAKTVLILPNYNTIENEDSNVDYDVVMTKMVIDSTLKNHTCQVISVLEQASSIKFITSSRVQYEAAGRIYVRSQLDTLMVQAFYNPYVTDIIKGICQHVVLQPVPTEFTNDCFGVLFDAFINNQSSIVIGLYRARSEMPYVLTCPSRNLIVHEADYLFVI